MLRFEGLEVRPVAGALGAEIVGVDPLKLDDAGFAAVYAALLEYEVIFFRETEVDDDTQLALAARFGKPSVFPLQAVMGVTEPTFQVIEDGPDSPNEADGWHTDVTWAPEPPKVALLRSSVVPERGGDTLWGSMTRAYEGLAPPLQRLLDELEIFHDNSSFLEGVSAKLGAEQVRELGLAEKLRAAYPGVKHPAVRTHPETGRRALLYGGGFMRRVVGLSPIESAGILALLERHISDARFHCRWSWRPGDLAIWDERATTHRAAGDHFPQRRIVHRCVVDGDRPYFDATQGAPARREAA